MLKRPLPEKASMEFEESLGLIFPDTEPQVSELEHYKISVCEPHIGSDEREYVKRVMDSGWLSSLGPEVKNFERNFAEKIGVKHAISCSNGTAALHLALATLGIGPGDEVIIPTFTMIATINAVLYCGATPVLVDADYTMNMDVLQIVEKITPRTKCILPVHIYGYPCNMEKIREIAAVYNLWVVEDVAESHGAKFQGEMTGSIGDIGAFSCYANKMITTGEGGLLTTNDDELAERMRTLMNHAFSPERHFCHRLLGYNYRMTALQAAVGNAQVKNWDTLISNRKWVKAQYIWELQRIEEITIPNKIVGKGIEPICWMFGVQVDKDKKNWIRNELANRGIETRNFFVPMHLQPVHYERFKGQRYPISEMLMETGFYLPSSGDLKTEDIEYICDQLSNIVVCG